MSTFRRFFHFGDLIYLTDFIGQSSILHVFQWKLILVISRWIYLFWSIWLWWMIILDKTFCHIPTIWPWPNFQGHSSHFYNFSFKLQRWHVSWIWKIEHWYFTPKHLLGPSSHGAKFRWFWLALRSQWPLTFCIEINGIKCTPVCIEGTNEAN